MSAEVLDDWRIRIVGGLEKTPYSNLQGRVYPNVRQAALALGFRGNAWTYWRRDDQTLDALRMQFEKDEKDDKEPWPAPGKADLPTNFTRSGTKEPPGDAQGTESGLDLEHISDEARKADAKEAMLHFIESVITTYEREKHRYRELIDHISAGLPEPLADEDGIQVTDRVKSSKSLREKLQADLDKFVDCSDLTGGDLSERAQLLSQIHNRYLGTEEPPEESQPQIGDEDDGRTLQQRVLDLVPDLAGIRVTVYRNSQRLTVLNNALYWWPCAFIEDAAQNEVNERTLKKMNTSETNVYRTDHIGRKVYSGRSDNLYEADHLRLIYLTTGEGEGVDALNHLHMARCEMQITTVTRHVLNEVGHDVLYKSRMPKSPSKHSAVQKSVPQVAEPLAGHIAEDLDKIGSRIDELYGIIRREVYGEIEWEGESTEWVTEFLNRAFPPKNEQQTELRRCFQTLIEFGLWPDLLTINPDLELGNSGSVSDSGTRVDSLFEVGPLEEIRARDPRFWFTDEEVRRLDWLRSVLAGESSLERRLSSLALDSDLDNWRPEAAHKLSKHVEANLSKQVEFGSGRKGEKSSPILVQELDQYDKAKMVIDILAALPRNYLNDFIDNDGHGNRAGHKKESRLEMIKIVRFFLELQQVESDPA